MLPPPLSKTDLHLLHVFATVVEARGFSAAQIELNVSPSTISRQISDLELRLGMTLCQRGRAGFLLTDKGEMVYRSAQRLFAAVREFDETVQDSQGSLAGNLAIATVDNWVFNDQSPFALALNELVETAPEVNVELFSLAPDDIEIAVTDTRVALGLGVFHRHKPGLIYEPVSTERVRLYCAQGHPLFVPQPAEELRENLTASRYAKRAYLREHDIAPVSRGLQANAHAHQTEGIAQLILTGRYIGYLPEEFANIWVSRGQMRAVGGDMFNQPSEIKLVRKRGAALSSPARAFETLIRKYASA